MLSRDATYSRENLESLKCVFIITKVLLTLMRGFPYKEWAVAGYFQSTHVNIPTSFL